MSEIVQVGVLWLIFEAINEPSSVFNECVDSF